MKGERGNEGPECCVPAGSLGSYYCWGGSAGHDHRGRQGSIIRPESCRFRSHTDDQHREGADKGGVRPARLHPDVHTHSTIRHHYPFPDGKSVLPVYAILYEYRPPGRHTAPNSDRNSDHPRDQSHEHEALRSVRDVYPNPHTNPDPDAYSHEDGDVHAHPDCHPDQDIHPHRHSDFHQYTVADLHQHAAPDGYASADGYTRPDQHAYPADGYARPDQHTCPAADRYAGSPANGYACPATDG